MISTSHKYVFVPVMKTGTQSIIGALKEFNVNNDDKHYTAYELKTGDFQSKMSKYFANKNKQIHLARDNWDEYFTFGFVRNPWDHFVSLYSWCKKHGSTKLEFKDFLKQQYKTNYESLADWNFTSCSDRLYHEDKPIVDYIGKLETIDKDWAYITSKIGVNKKLPKINTTKRKDYKSYYDSEGINLISKMYIKDIERFNYEF